MSHLEKVLQRLSDEEIYEGIAVSNHGGAPSAKEATLVDKQCGNSKPEPHASKERSNEHDLLPPPMWPQLSETAKYGLAGEVAKTACENSEVDPAAVLFTFLAWAGISFGSTVHVAVGDAKQYARIYIGIMGASSKARKGTSKAPCERIFGMLPADLRCRVTGGPLSSGEGIVFAVRDASEKLDKDGQSEDPGITDKRLFVIESEWAASLQSTKRESNTLSAIMRMAFDDGNVDPLTKHNRIKATNAHIGFVGHITLEEFAKLLNEVDVYNGYINRILFACVRRQKLVANPKPMLESAVKDFADRLEICIRKAQRLSKIGFSDEAQKTWNQVYYHLTEDRQGRLGAVLARAEALVIRLALVFALLDQSDTIERDHLRAALAAWKFCFQSAAYIFGQQQEDDPVRAKILEALATGEKSLTELNRLFHGHSTTTVRTSLTELQAVGRILQRRDGGGKAKGQPSTYIRLNPAFKPSRVIDDFA